MSPRLEVRDLHLSFSGRPVLAGVDFTLHSGEFAGLIGPNGTGKSSLLRAIAGNEVVSRGQVIIDGHDLTVQPVAARAALGYAVEPERIPALLSGRQCVELIARLREQDASLGASWDLCRRLALSPWLDHPVHTYSLGTRQKLAVVLALVGAPSVIVLDEVLNGLDPLAAFALKQELRTHADRGAAILLATHGLEVAERFLDRALLLLDGRIAADWDAAALADFRADPEGGLEHAVVQRLRDDGTSRSAAS
jgi:ABC-2 type transport system ATP-binding protein